jgi:hypothetical protein
MERVLTGWFYLLIGGPMVSGILFALLFWVLVIGGVAWAVTRASKSRGRNAPASPLKPVKTAISRAELMQRITTHFSARGYTILSQSENTVVVQDGKDIDGCLLVFFLLLLAVGALIYYLAARSRQVVVTLEKTDNFIVVNAVGNTLKSQDDASNFLGSLPVSS